jgi:hypothetical protein
VPIIRAPAIEKAALKDEAALRRRIRAYYERQWDREVDRLQALRLSTRRRKLALIAVGGVLLAATLAAVAADKLGYAWFQDREPYEIAAGLAALALLFTALLIRPVEQVPETRQVEREVDEQKYRDINACISATGKLIKGPGEGPVAFELRLEGYPDKQEVEGRGVLVAGRIGVDGLPRFTPVKVTALSLFNESLAIYQVTVDLTNGRMISERLLELAYRDIVSLERSSLAVAVPSERDPGRILAKIRGRARQQLRDKDTLSIHFGSQASIAIVLRDTSFAELMKGAKLPLSSTHENIESFWHALRSKWLEATGRGK